MKRTLKDQAFELFSQGYFPRSQEVKALGLHQSNRYKYFAAWEALGKPAEAPSRHSQSAMVSTKSPGGETIGGIDETKQQTREIPRQEAEKVLPKEELGAENDKAENLEEKQEPEAEKGESKEQPEGIGVVSEAKTLKEKTGKPEEERKIATTIADDGIKCVVFLSLQTLALFKIASNTQTQYENGNPLLLGDFIDTCVEDYFDGRGKKLGLIISGGR